MKEQVIVTRGLTKTYADIQALKDIDIHVRRGDIYGLIGDNGAGKSTLLKLLAGQSFATAGEIVLMGKSGEKGLGEARKNTGFMVEQPGFFPNMTVEQTLKYYSIQKGVPDKRKAEEMLSVTGLEAKRKSKCGRLSLGQKQRLGLAIALLGEPEILILDEPINGLDPSGIVEFRGLLYRLNKEKNITIMLSSHILSELQQIANVYGFLSKGVLLEEISAQTLEERCSDSIELTLSDMEQFVVLLERKLPAETYKVLPGGVLRIYAPRETPETYSRLAAENGIYITGMQARKNSLEEYYLKLKEGAKR